MCGEHCPACSVIRGGYLGCNLCVISPPPPVQLLTTVPPPGNLVGLEIWSAVEPCVGVIGACILSLRPLIALLLGHSFAAKSKPANSSVHSSSFFSKNRNEDEDLTPISPLHDHELSSSSNHHHHHNDARGPYPWRSHDATISGGTPKNTRKDAGSKRIGQNLEYEELDTPPSSGIRVRTEVILSRSERLDYNDRLF